MAAFLRALIGTTQVKGGYYEPASQACAIAGFVERLEQGLYPLPPLSGTDLAGRPPRAGSRTVVVADLSEVGLQGMGGVEGIGVALARAYAAPGVRLCLVGGVAETLDHTADDARRRGALVETFDLAGRAEPALADYLAALDRRMPVDTLVVHAGPQAEPVDRHLPDGYLATGHPVEAEIGGAMRVVAAIEEPMRCRGRGEIVLIDSLAGRPATGDPRAVLCTTRALRSYGAALRRRLQAYGVSVAVVLPRGGAIRAAARLREPGLALEGADRIAERIARGLPRSRAAVAIPGPGALAMRTLRLMPSRVRGAVRTMLLPSPGAIREPADEGPLPGESGPGD